MEITRIEEIKMILENGAGAAMTLPEIIREEIDEFVKSPQFDEIVAADEYYRNRSDVQRKKNDIKDRSNTRIEHPYLKRFIEQKANFLLAKPFSVESKNEQYTAALEDMFNNTFRQKIKRFAKSAVKSGIAWLAPYFDTEKGKNVLKWQLLPSREVIPLWEDYEHEKISGYIRFYPQTVYEGKNKKTIEKVEFWSADGVKKFVADNIGGTLKPDYDPETGLYEYSHVMIGDKPFNWEAVPVVWLKYTDEELPLLHYLRELIDDINWQTSVTADVLRDVAKVIYVLRNYGGADLNEFVRDLRKCLAIQVEGDGAVDTLAPALDINAVMQFLDKNRRDLFDFANAVDTKDPELGNASGLAINFRYMDLDNDCAALGANLKAAFERMKLFIDPALKAAGKGDFTNDNFDIVFNTDLPVNETEIINNIRDSDGIISKHTQRVMHPYVTDVEEEEKQIKKEQEEARAEFGDGLFDGAFNVGDNKQNPNADEE